MAGEAGRNNPSGDLTVLLYHQDASPYAKPPRLRRSPAKIDGHTEQARAPCFASSRFANLHWKLSNLTGGPHPGLSRCPVCLRLKSPHGFPDGRSLTDVSS